MSEPLQLPLHDCDPQETQEWKDALDSVLEFEGTDRAQFLLKTLMAYANQRSVSVPGGIQTAYINTISVGQESKMPEADFEVFERLTNVMRWNAIAMVMRAGKISTELGGHIASFGSIATLFEVGLHYFFHAPSAQHGGDLVYFQRLDGPVWGNGKIIQEYEGVFRGAGWNVIKVIWGSGWDALFAKGTAG